MRAAVAHHLWATSSSVILLCAHGVESVMRSLPHPSLCPVVSANTVTRRNRSLRPEVTSAAAEAWRRYPMRRRFWTGIEPYCAVGVSDERRRPLSAAALRSSVAIHKEILSIDHHDSSVACATLVVRAGRLWYKARQPPHQYRNIATRAVEYPPGTSATGSQTPTCRGLPSSSSPISL